MNLDNLHELILPLCLILSGILLGIISEKNVLQRLLDFTDGLQWKIYSSIVKSIKGITFIWFVLAGFYLALFTVSLNPTLQNFIHKAIIAIFIGSATFAVAKLAVNLIQLNSEKQEGSSTLTSLFESLTNLIIYSLGLLIVLESVGIGITPLITALGLGSLSIGLAFQGTLENLISGITILTSKKIHPGDYIKLKSGEEGYVVDIELKYTVIREITDNLIVIPNAQIISSSFTNYGLPNKEILIPVEIGVSYGSDLEKVENVALRVAKEVIEEMTNKDLDKGLDKSSDKDSDKDLEYQPFIRYNKLDYFSINFTVYLQVSDFFDQITIKHEFIKRLYNRFQAENIQLPFPLKNAYNGMQLSENN
jgi:small-conductance mechanosensitive channel